MHNTLIVRQNKTISPDKLGIFGEDFSLLKAGGLLNKAGITKTKGASLLELFSIVFNLSFIGKNSFEGVVRNKKVELLSKVYDHCTGKYLKGFRMLTLGWSVGNNFLGVDKRTCGYQRRKEAITKSTELLEPMIKRALGLGLRAKYLVMDSWFSMAS